MKRAGTATQIRVMKIKDRCTNIRSRKSPSLYAIVPTNLVMRSTGKHRIFEMGFLSLRFVGS
jgi:hypothetical protein